MYAAACCSHATQAKLRTNTTIVVPPWLYRSENACWLPSASSIVTACESAGKGSMRECWELQAVAHGNHDDTNNSAEVQPIAW